MKKMLMKFIPNQLKKKYYEYRKKTYMKNEVTCLICNSSYKKFLSFGIKKRKNAKCLNCGSLERHRLIWKYINDKKLLNKRLSILHFAPEKVFYDLFSTSNDIEYFPCDLEPENYNYTGRTKIIKADITNIPFDSKSFDFILCNHVLEHVPDDNLAMSELFRVMKDGGIGLFLVPVDYNRESTYEDFSITTPEGRLKTFGQHDHVRRYGRDYKDRLENAGFQVVEDDFATTFSKKEQLKYGLASTGKIYLCKKTVAN